MTPPFAWARKIAAHLKAYDQIPLFGKSPLFDWHRFSSMIASRFGIQNLSVRADTQSWRTWDELKEGLGEHVLTIPLKIGPLTGSAFWMMSREEINQLTSWMLHGRPKSKPLQSEVLAEGFYRYLLLQVLDAASGMEPLQKFSMVISEESPMPQTDAFCIDVEIELDQKSCWGRLAIEPQLQKSWVQFFDKLPSEYAPNKMAQSVELALGLKVGATLLQRTDWDKLKVGDAVILDQGSYDPRKEKGAAYLTLGPLPLFQVKIKQNKIQLVDYAFTYEEKMDKKMAPESPENPFSGPAELLPPAGGEAMALKEMPVHLTVELARLRVTLEKLMQLSPGNLIELPISPDQGVQLTVNGQLVGRGELVHLGEALGIRILEIG